MSSIQDDETLEMKVCHNFRDLHRLMTSIRQFRRLARERLAASQTARVQCLSLRHKLTARSSAAYLSRTDLEHRILSVG